MSKEDEAFLTEQLGGFEILGFLPSDQKAIESDRRGEAVFALAEGLVERVSQIVDRLATE